MPHPTSPASPASFRLNAVAAAACLVLGAAGANAQTSAPAPARAASDAQTLDPVLVRGARAQNRESLSNATEALPAQTYIIDRERLEAQSFSDATDLLRATPGVTFGSSSPGGDIGDDISIRGFNGFHGAQTAIYIDGMPINWSHSRYGAHGLGDINWLTPEMIERIEVVKGPFSALYGNFNLAGAINIVTRSSDASSVALEGGSYDHYRATGVYSRPMTAGSTGVTPFLLVDGLYRGGYRDRSDYRRANSFNKLTMPLGDGRLSVRLNASIRDFNSGGFLLADDVRNGIVDRRSASLDSGGDRGRLEYVTALANYVPLDDRGPTATIYLSNERQRLADTSFGPPQAYLASKRTVGGLRVAHNFRFERALLTAGLEAQAMKVNNRNADTDGSGNPTDDTVRTQVEEQSAGLFVQGQVKVIETLKLVGGLRYDRFRTKVDNKLFPDSGRASTDTWSPKIGVAWLPIAEVELFVNHGRGFRSPSANELSPERTGATFNDNLGVLKLRSSDLGATFRPLAGLSLTAAAFRTDTDGELRRDPADPINVVNIGGTRRNGYEVYGEWAFGSSWAVSASHTKVDTRIKQPATPGADLVITVPDTTQTATVSWHGPLPMVVGARLNVDVFAQRIGKRPLAADGSLYAEAQNTVGAKARVTRGRVSGFLQVDWKPDRYSSDFIYDLGSGPVYDPQPRLALLLGVRYAFD